MVWARTLMMFLAVPLAGAPAGSLREPGRAPQVIPASPQVPPGRVTPLPVPQPDPTSVEVLAAGTATVFGGNVAAARQVALQAAYAEAVSRGAGVDLGRLTVVKNVKFVTDVLTSRSRGFIKSYDIVGEELRPGEPPSYEVRIRGLVAQHAPDEQSEREGLRLFLAVLGKPTVLIVLPDAEVPEQLRADWVRIRAERDVVALERGRTDTVPASPNLTALGAEAQFAGGLRAPEAALAEVLVEHGYNVLTSDDLIVGGHATAGQIEEARRGVTVAARQAARSAGADVLISGVIRLSTHRTSPQGVDLVSATAVGSAKAMIVSTGSVVDAIHHASTRAHRSTLAAVASTMEEIAAAFGASLAWRIPTILASEPRVTRVRIAGLPLDTAQRVKAAFERLEGIESVRFVAIPTATQPTTELELHSGFVLAPADEVIAACSSVVGRTCRAHSADKFELHMSVVE